jgi:hypothetical protein
MATAKMPPEGLDFAELVDTVADDFEENKQMEVTPDGRQALVEPAIPYQDQVQNELLSGKITHQFLRQSVTAVLDNGYEIAMAENLSAIDRYVVQKSIKKYCPYIMWC